jgi:hypothetical protein
MKLAIILFVNIVSYVAYGQDTNLSEKIKRYEASKSVKDTLTHMHKKVLSASKGMCASFVRQGYMASGMIKRSPGINYAKDYHPYFNEENWTDIFNTSNVKLDLNATPAGCAIVYDAIDPQNDRNGYIGHIEVRTKGFKESGYISDYFSRNPRTGLECEKKGKVVSKTRVFIARDSSPFHRGGAKITKSIKVTTCLKYSSKGAIVGDEFINRKVIGVSCKFD